MTTPTPEAIEAAARAIADADLDNEPSDWQRELATAALSAAYPLVEAQAKAEALREAADDLNPQLREYRLGAHEVLTQRIKPAGGDDTRSLQLALVAAKHTESWLRARASTIEAAE